MGLDLGTNPPSTLLPPQTFKPLLVVYLAIPNPDLWSHQGAYSQNDDFGPGRLVLRSK